MKALRTIYRYWITLIWLAVVVQIAAAAYGAFYAADKLGDQKGSDETKMISEKAYDHGFGFHTGFGYAIFLGAVLLLLIALAARLGKRRVLLALAVAGLLPSSSRSCLRGSARAYTRWGPFTGSTRSSSSASLVR